MGERAAIELGGVALELLGERAVWWAAERTVFVADVHLGKSAAYRASGVPAPEATTARDLDRLGALLARTGAGRLVVLGDLVHSHHWSGGATRAAVDAWVGAHRGVEVWCVLGNHDRGAGGLPAGIAAHAEPWSLGPLTLVHDPALARAGEPTLAGHLHPAVRLGGGPAGSGMRAACFWQTGMTLVLPAFGSFTGSGVVRARAGDRAWAVEGGVIVEARGRAGARV